MFEPDHIIASPPLIIELPEPLTSTCIECGARIPAADDACERCIMGPDYVDGFRPLTYSTDRPGGWWS